MTAEECQENNTAGLAMVKSEKSETPSPLSATEGNGALDLTATQPGRNYIKEESHFTMLFLNRDRGVYVHSQINRNAFIAFTPKINLLTRPTLVLIVLINCFINILLNDTNTKII